MKMTKSFSIALLLAFLAFTFLHNTKAPKHQHFESKAVILIGDWVWKEQPDDEKKQPFILTFLRVLPLNFLEAGIILGYFAVCFIRNDSFLIPVFHQSNYVIFPLQK
ncbi:MULTISPECIES: hypothetical protein [Neobacillus]|jgi:Na+/H+ antiporter NhaC|uniref:Uncharacterized protein n=1 Tax=Neobacillus sedimentimangrovi TaxID=2699460 RepID=A0ABS8QJ07_9BACI|nr:hypothetical protein [Neobacillus sedimentimangrovi]AIM16848.1 hypothetical protein HW35_11870 [Bacillus sp. X1(2014)]MCD4839167.1 hypothetical protein [Neobacillus sedimentimangrovi]